MTRVVEAVAPEFEAHIGWEKVITKELSGAMRYGELSKRLGRPAPVPSIFINGELIFDMTPSLEDLSNCLQRLIAESES
jgi:hypothetical protein